MQPFVNPTTDAGLYDGRGVLLLSLADQAGEVDQQQCTILTEGKGTRLVLTRWESHKNHNRDLRCAQVTGMVPFLFERRMSVVVNIYGYRRPD